MHTNKHSQINKQRGKLADLASYAFKNTYRLLPTHVMSVSNASTSLSIKVCYIYLKNIIFDYYCYCYCIVSLFFSISFLF